MHGHMNIKYTALVCNAHLKHISKEFWYGIARGNVVWKKESVY